MQFFVVWIDRHVEKKTSFKKGILLFSIIIQLDDDEVAAQKHEHLWVCEYAHKNSHTHKSILFGKCKQRNSNKNYFLSACTCTVSYSHFSFPIYPVESGVTHEKCVLQLTAYFHLTFTNTYKQEKLYRCVKTFFPFLLCTKSLQAATAMREKVADRYWSYAIFSCMNFFHPHPKSPSSRW